MLKKDKQKNIEAPIVSKSPKEKARAIIKKKPKEKFLNDNQRKYWELIDKNQINFCVGVAGTGKSHVTMQKALSLLFDENNNYEKIIIIRPAVEAEENLGFLPGNLEEKLDPYIYPSYYLMDKIIGKEAREKLKNENIIEVAALAYLRGWNVDNSILLFEEAQNSTPDQMKLLLTRIGFNSKFLISGDFEQTDKYKNDKTKSGLYDAIKRFDDMDDIGIFKFDINDVVRNPLISKILNKYG
jgi:phosphate starvation-inducible PhoH-like protein